MRLSTKATMITGAALWGGCMLFVGLLNWFRPAYGMDFLQIFSSVYPGYHATHTLGSVAIGTIYGALDGAIGGYLFAAIYDYVIAHSRRPIGPAAKA